MNVETTRKAPYQSLAAIYDQVMRHVDYPAWATYVDSVLQRYGPRPTHLVDLACGTGNISMRLCDLGYQVTGIDGSESMIEAAQRKADGADRSVRFLCRDLRDLGNVGPFAAAVCMYDSMNYLLTPEDFDRALQQVRQTLELGALFVFDVCTEQNSLRYFRDARDRESGPGFSYERHSRYDRRERLQYNQFRIYFDGREGPVEETHVQRIYALAEIEARIAPSAFELLALFDDFTFKEGSEESDRVHFALRAC